MDQNSIKKENVAAPSIAAAPNAAAPTALPVATPAPATTVTTTVDANKRPAPVGNASLAAAAPAAKKANTATVAATTPSQKTQLQQQIQQQLQQQLQAQLQAAAARGQQANITPEQIQVRTNPSAANCATVSQSACDSGRYAKRKSKQLRRLNQKSC